MFFHQSKVKYKVISTGLMFLSICILITLVHGSRIQITFNDSANQKGEHNNILMLQKEMTKILKINGGDKGQSKFISYYTIFAT